MLAETPALLRAPEPGTGFSPLATALLGGTGALPALAALREGGLQVDDLRAPCPAGRTPLHLAARAHVSGSTSLEWLLREGVPASAMDCDGVTPLHEAMRNHEAPLEAAQLLLAAGADKSVKDSKGMTPGDLATVRAAHRVLLNADEVLAKLGVDK
jgi:ankyrin repeat protein